MDGTEINNPNSIKEAVRSFYKELYKETEQWRPDLNLHGGTKISVEEQAWLQKPFEEEEIVKCLDMCAMETLLVQMVSQWFSSKPSETP